MSQGWIRHSSWSSTTTLLGPVSPLGTALESMAGEISMRVNEQAFEWLDGPILRVTAIDSPVPYAGTLEEYFLPQVADVLTAVRYLARY